MSMRWIIPKSAGNGKEKCSTTQRQYSFYSTRLSEYRVIRSFDVIISNPPYIGTEEEVDIENSVKDFEPMMALFAPQNDVLAFYRKIANDTDNKLADGGYIFLEINQKL